MTNDRTATTTGPGKRRCGGSCPRSWNVVSQPPVGRDSVPPQSAGRSQDAVGPESQPTWLEYCHTRFPLRKLLDRLRIDWQDNHSLPVQLARAQIAGLRTAGDSQGRYQAKWQLVRNLYEIGYNAEQVRELFGLIDWMIHLRLDLEQRFKQELDQFEEGLQMPYVTSVERIARAEGRTEAGGAAVLLKLLGKRWGSVAGAGPPADPWFDVRAVSRAKHRSRNNCPMSPRPSWERAG